MNEPHSTALELLERHLATVTKYPEEWYALFDNDAVVEFPYASGTSFPPRLEGKAAIRAYFDEAVQWFGPFTFRDAHFFGAAGSDCASCEVHGSTTVKATGAAYEQNYVFVVEARGGRIVRYREYWNPLLGMVVAP